MIDVDRDEERALEVATAADEALDERRRPDPDARGDEEREDGAQRRFAWRRP